MLHALRALRFTAWTLLTRARLARVGVRASIAADGTPRYRTLPHVEPIPGRGRLAIRIGREADEAVLGRGVAVHATAGVTIGARVGVGERTSIIDSDHTDDGRGWRASPLNAEPIAIADDALLSANCVVLRGARIGPRAIVAANSVVRAGEHAGGWLVAGNPAEAIRALP